MQARRRAAGRADSSAVTTAPLSTSAWDRCILSSGKGWPRGCCASSCSGHRGAGRTVTLMTGARASFKLIQVVVLLRSTGYVDLLRARPPSCHDSSRRWAAPGRGRSAVAHAVPLVDDGRRGALHKNGAVAELVVGPEALAVAREEQIRPRHVVRESKGARDARLQSVRRRVRNRNESLLYPRDCDA